MWQDNSDRNLKTNFESINPRDILDRVSKLKVQKWNYKADDKSFRHIGPVAQDFSAAFAIGYDNKHISALDENGVALAAIQGLAEEVK
jgi:hypothetical protein